MVKKILFNCTTNNMGGGIKNSAIFIKYALQESEIEWYFAISREVKIVLENWDISIDGMYLFNISPARDTSKRVELFDLSKKLDVNLVYTMAGPAYVNFEMLHVMGISNPYVTHAGFQAIAIDKSIVNLLKAVMLTTYQAYFSRKADYFIFQTNQSRKSFCKRLFINTDRTKVISNSIGNEFIEYFKEKSIKVLNHRRKIKIFCPASPFPHKALHLIPKIAFELKKISNNKYDFKFILTINKETSLYKKIQNESRILGIENQILTIGVFNYTDAPKLYNDADIIFVPSILETFSANYLEAFISKKLLVVTDKDFSRDICQDGAIYINPFDAKMVAKSFDRVILDSNVQIKTINKGLMVIKKYGDQKRRNEHIIKYLKEILS